LRLEPARRRCFVLRMLVAMPREMCARLLELDAGEIDRHVSRAAEDLAVMSGGREEGTMGYAGA
jgi:DNA-directed RNA polymerase specialized sigma24 family protein